MTLQTHTPPNEKRIPQPPVVRLLVIETAVLVLATLIGYLLDGVLARSVLIGGLTYLLPQAWFAHRAFRFQGARAAPQMVNSFYRGEAGKFLLTTAAFVATFILVRPLNVVAFFSAFAALNLINIMILARMTRD